MSRLLNKQEILENKLYTGSDASFIMRSVPVLKAQRDLSDRETRKEIGFWLNDQRHAKYEDGNLVITIPVEVLDKLLKGERP